MEDFRDPETARRWSADPVTHNPTRTEQLDILLAVLASEYRPGKAILDLGFGSGIVDQMVLERISAAYIVGVDGSPAMVALADERLAGYRGRYTTVIHDLTDIKSLRLPPREYGFAISVQTIHNVADKFKRQAFQAIYDALEDGGLFLLMDRIAVDTPRLFNVYKAVWDRLETKHHGHIMSREGETFEHHRDILANRGDQPASLEQHLDWLREIGFEVACIHLHGNRALLAARKLPE